MDCLRAAEQLRDPTERLRLHAIAHNTSCLQPTFGNDGTTGLG
jgi:hypothetical protein